MKADVPVLVKAGIAPSVTKQLLEQLDVKDPVSTEQNVRYDPLGVEIKLNVDDKMFKVRPVTEGRKPIIPGDPAIWIWELTPLKCGKALITIQAFVELKVPGIDDSYRKDTIVFSEEREVQINLGYTVSQAVSNYWKEISTFLFGSGSIAAGFKFWIDRKSQQEKTSEKGQDVVGFARSLPGNKKNNK
ncbi:MAG: hypothetical protein KME07_06305 [Pegethrix bostrychoides GSE-TBD4-15B]|uniref:Uncharacterized protein n=1 Tax=Pegethrix bostrychoides GSE-TBD4-15B TaxID=2839662 RepID=A0A951P8G5_9CYAN|nr:hypothetical protein [Pegethrix bostrychoides GSE-TBD4-15B]